MALNAEKVVDMKNPEAWHGAVIPKGYEINNSGVYVISEKSESSQKISGPVWVSAGTEDEMTGVYGVQVQWIDKKGKIKSHAFPADLLHEQGRSLVQYLARKGLAITPNKERLLLEYLASFDRHKWMSSVSKIGWLDSQVGKLVYVRPDEESFISSSEDELIIFQPELHSPTVETMFCKGTLNEWKQHIAARCLGNPVLIFCLTVPFASILLKFASLESGGFHLYGKTTGGKTTAAQVAASVFGCGSDPGEAPEKSYIQRWNTTGNAMEALLAAHNDALLVMDEIHTSSVNDLMQLIYNISGGRGKSVMTKNRLLREQRVWRTLVLSTGEISVRQKIEVEGGKTYAGAMLRMIDIPTYDGTIIESHGMDARDFADNLKVASGKYFGTAAPEYIRQILSSFDTSFSLSATVKERMRQVEPTLAPSNIEPEQRRELKRFALLVVAGEMAISMGILPFDKGVVQEAIKEILKIRFSDVAFLSERLRGCQTVQAFIIRNRSRFREFGCSSPVRDEVGLYHKAQGQFLINSEGFKEACGNHDTTSVASELNRLGLLKDRERGRYLKKVSVDGARQRFYIIEQQILESDFVFQICEQADDAGANGAGGAG